MRCTSDNWSRDSRSTQPVAHQRSRRFRRSWSGLLAETVVRGGAENALSGTSSQSVDGSRGGDELGRLRVSAHVRPVVRGQDRVLADGQAGMLKSRDPPLLPHPARLRREAGIAALTEKGDVGVVDHDTIQARAVSTLAQQHDGSTSAERLEIVGGRER